MFLAFDVFFLIKNCDQSRELKYQTGIIDEQTAKIDTQSRKIDYQTALIEELKETSNRYFQRLEAIHLTQTDIKQEQQYITKSQSSPPSDKDVWGDPNIPEVDNQGRGLFRVVIGYSETAEGAVRQAREARHRGFPQARANRPYKDNPYYGVTAGDHLTLSEAKKLLERAKEYYPDAWAWQWHP